MPMSLAIATYNAAVPGPLLFSVTTRISLTLIFQTICEKVNHNTNVGMHSKCLAQLASSHQRLRSGSRQAKIPYRHNFLTSCFFQC